LYRGDLIQRFLQAPNIVSGSKRELWFHPLDFERQYIKPERGC
jgi:hypothetical protein